MIIIKIIILYFIQFRHTDYFLSTGNLLVVNNLCLARWVGQVTRHSFGHHMKVNTEHESLSPPPLKQILITRSRSHELLAKKHRKCVNIVMDSLECT